MEKTSKPPISARSADTSGSDFAFNRVKDFDTHISVSIPNYEHIHELVICLASYFLTPGTNVYDLGCSTGLLLRKLADRYPYDTVKFIGYDIEPNLLPDIDAGQVVYVRQDITNESVSFTNTNLVLSIFTIQFLAPLQRRQLIKKIYRSLNPGGAFILTEKVFSHDGRIQDIYTFSHYDLKAQSFTSEQIIGKQSKLREIMKPLPRIENERLLKDCGFKTIDSFFQSLNFLGWLCIK